jgi:hypothetical protein
MKELYDMLVTGGMDKEKAKTWIVDLQNSKGLGSW